MLVKTIHHDALPGYVANEHIDWTAASNAFYTTSTARIDAGLGIGRAPLAGRLIDVVGSFTTETAIKCIYLKPTRNSDTNTSSLDMKSFECETTLAGSGNITGASSVSATRNHLLVYGSGASHTGVFAGMRCEITMCAFLGNLTMSSMRNLYLKAPGCSEVSGTVACTDYYGIYMDSVVNDKITRAWALYSAGGQSYHAGNFSIGGTTFNATAAKVLQIVDSTQPGAAVADAVQIYEKDSSQGAGHGTLGLYLEEAVEALGTFTASNKIRVWINGTEYHIQLDAV